MAVLVCRARKAVKTSKTLCPLDAILRTVVQDLVSVLAERQVGFRTNQYLPHLASTCSDIQPPRDANPQGNCTAATSGQSGIACFDATSTLVVEEPNKVRLDRPPFPFETMSIFSTGSDECFYPKCQYHRIRRNRRWQVVRHKPDYR